MIGTMKIVATCLCRDFIAFFMICCTNVRVIGCFAEVGMSLTDMFVGMARRLKADDRQVTTGLLVLY